MDIDKLVRVYQKRFEKSVNASRILPSLLSHVDAVLGVKRFLERLEDGYLVIIDRNALESALRVA
ncbi:MAG: hypothetical protein LZ174_10605 [Thaumarchaeota archaeon]|jgi:hypothetical protein|nr:hypothetical protein [Candidatus Geocrenenecus arthurdayi]